MDVHVVPVNDLRDHVECRGCWCRPAIESREWADNAVVVHHALDGREYAEPDHEPTEDFQ